MAAPPNNSFVNLPSLLPTNVVEWRWNPNTNQIEPVQSDPLAPPNSGSVLVQQSVLNVFSMLQSLLVEMQVLNYQIAQLGNLSDTDSFRASLSATPGDI